MRRILTLMAVIFLVTGCADESRGGPWQISEYVEADVQDVGESETADLAGDIDAAVELNFVGELYGIASGLERVAIVLRDKNSALCVSMVLASPAERGPYEDVRTPENWILESVVGKTSGCNDPPWPSREGERPSHIEGEIELFQGQARDAVTEASVDVSITFPENDHDIPGELHLELSAIR